MINNNLAIEVVGLTKHYGEVLSIERISFKVKREEIFGFLGPNGASKTTTVPMLTGIIQPDGRYGLNIWE